MKIEVDKKHLLRSINIADSIISSKHVHTILSNCLFKVSLDEIEIISTDNEIGIKTRLDAVSDSEMSFTVYGKNFEDLLKLLPDGLILIDVNEDFLIDIKTKKVDVDGNFRLIGKGVEEFPEIPTFSDEELIEIEQPVLKEIIRRVVYAAAVDTIKPVFNGIYILSENKGEITAVSSDSRRLSMTKMSISNDVNINEGIIIPLKTINEVYRLLMPEGLCKFYFGENQCFFKIGETDIISRIINGKFPNYNQVIPKEFKIESVINRDSLLDTLSRAKTFTREPSNKIIMHFGNDILSIEAKTQEVGECQEKLKIESNNKEEISIGINVQFLIDAVREIDNSSIVIGVTGEMSPVTVSPEGDSNFISVVMPIQIKPSQGDLS